jgi:hypothetical protein
MRATGTVFVLSANACPSLSVAVTRTKNLPNWSPTVKPGSACNVVPTKD